jgi:phosphonate transport system ATP-binding protein
VREDGLSLLVISHRLEHTLRIFRPHPWPGQGRIALDRPPAGRLRQLRQFFDQEAA